MVKALKSMFGSDNATWMVVGVVVVILIIVVVCYFGKSQKSAPYVERFSEKKSAVIQNVEILNSGVVLAIMEVMAQ